MSLTVIKCSDINKFSKFITYITFTPTNGTIITSTSSSSSSSNSSNSNSSKNSNDNTNNNDSNRKSVLLSLNTSSDDIQQKILLVSSLTSTDLPEQTIYLEARNVVASRSAAVTHGYDVIDYNDDDDTKILSIQGTIILLSSSLSPLSSLYLGPDNIKIVLVQVTTNNNDIDDAFASKVIRYIETEVYKDNNDISKISSALPPSTPPSSSTTTITTTTVTKTSVKESLEWNPSQGAHIPSIMPSLLHKSQYRPITANSPQAIPFENEIFAGILTLLLPLLSTQH